jgi:SAM-dependent methyltransferase
MAVLGPPQPRYPVPTEPSLLDRAVLRVGMLPMRCPVCGHLALARGFGENLRETGRCSRCGSTNRNRQVAVVACRAATERTGRRVRDLGELSRSGLVVYNTEAQGPVHEALRAMPGYRASEYFGPEHTPGELVGGTLHEDLLALSFPDESIDLVLSSDVFEHVPDPYRGHTEVHRVLRPGGHHVFTVPFHQHAHLDDVRARLVDGEVQHRSEPIYHDDPVRAEGTLVFTIFGLEMLVRLADLGFDTRMFTLRMPASAIMGPNALVFDAVRVDAGRGEGGSSPVTPARDPRGDGDGS